jgi:hypothetical protein
MTRETVLTPELMIEELMYYIHQNEMGGDCIDPNNRFFPLYLELQKLKDKLDNDRYDTYVSVEKETLSNAVSKDDMSVAIYNDEVRS